MRYVKPLIASVVTRCFEHRRRFFLGVSVLLFSPTGRGQGLLPEQELWPFWAGRPESGAPLEEAFPRRHAEYLVGGTAYTRPDQHQGGLVRARVGPLRKELVVWGERFWTGQRPSDPKAFDSLPLDWAQTYGGPDVAENPVGMGSRDTEINGVRMRLLPRIEYPRQPLTSPSQRGVPAGLAPLDQTWAGRAAKRGTYDDRWLEEGFPGLASDIDWGFFNLAPEDQQQPDAFRGDEDYAFHGLHPTKPIVDGQLPGLTTRVFVTRTGAAGALFEELQTRLMALWFFPAEERLIQVFQGWIGVTEDDAADVEHLLTAVERLGQPRPIEHYRDVRERRLDREHGVIEALRESDLAPADLVQSPFDLQPSDSPGLTRALRRAKRERLAARTLIAEHGLNPDEHGPPEDLPEPPEIRSIDDLLAVRKQMEAEGAGLAARMAAEKQKAADDVRALVEAQGLDFGVIEREMNGELTRGPPMPMADALIRDLTGQVERGRTAGAATQELEQMLADPAVIAGWHQADRQQLAGYRSMGHHQAPATRLDPEAAAAVRERVVAHHSGGGSLAGWDLTGANLRGLDLTGSDLREALLDSADLSGARLDGARLSDAMLAHARLAQTCLDGADLQRCNLGGSRIASASLRGADLGEAILEQTRLSKSDLRDTRLDGARFEGASIDAVDFSGAHSEAMILMRGRDLRGSRFSAIRFAQAVFEGCDLRGTDFSDAHIAKAVFISIQADGASFRGLQLGAGCFVMGCRLDAADFTGARLCEVSLRGAFARGADFTGTELVGADLSECDLREAVFYAADARHARFVRADLNDADLGGCNLAGSVLQHARLGHTDLRQSNLHESDLARVRLGPAVQFDGALTTRVRTHPRYRPPSETS